MSIQDKETTDFPFLLAADLDSVRVMGESWRSTIAYLKIKIIICSSFEICHSIHGVALLSLLLCSIFLLLIDFIFLFPSMILAWQ